MKPLFITFEGLDGSGKSTQALLLKEWFESQGMRAVVTREPGGCEAAEGLRTLLLSRISELKGLMPAALLYAARMAHAFEFILPALESGVNVICDRFVSSTFAYQLDLPGRPGIQASILNRLEQDFFSSTYLVPSLEIFLDLPVEIALDRISSRGEPVSFFETSLKASAYAYAYRYGQRFMTDELLYPLLHLEASGSIPEVRERVSHAVRMHTLSHPSQDLQWKSKSTTTWYFKPRPSHWSQDASLQSP